MIELLKNTWPILLGLVVAGTLVFFLVLLSNEQGNDNGNGLEDGGEE